MGFFKEMDIERLNAVKCDCCNEDADYSDYGINLCYDCKKQNCEGWGKMYDNFVKADREDY